jgi:hypothetical protein
MKDPLNHSTKKWGVFGHISLLTKFEIGHIVLHLIC